MFPPPFCTAMLWILMSVFVVAMPLNCPGMYRGVVRADGNPKVAIFRDDDLEEVDNF